MSCREKNTHENCWRRCELSAAATKATSLVCCIITWNVEHINSSPIQSDSTWLWEKHFREDLQSGNFFYWNAEHRAASCGSQDIPHRDKDKNKCTQIQTNGIWLYHTNYREKKLQNVIFPVNAPHFSFAIFYSLKLFRSIFLFLSLCYARIGCSFDDSRHRHIVRILVLKVSSTRERGNRKNVCSSEWARTS